MNLLFLCTGNACRSQMAEGWARALGGDWLHVQSAGIESHGKNPRAIAVMAEAGIDISGQESTKLTDEMLDRADYVVTVCGHADEHCPALPPGTRKEHWPLDDPARASGTASAGGENGMTAQCETTAKRQSGAGMGFFESYLTLWVFLCIFAGIGLGHVFPGLFQGVGRLEVAQINLPVAVLIWLMIIPMLLKIDLKALKGVHQHWRGVAVTLFVNWGVKPFSMALLAWLFIDGLFRPWLPAGQIDSYVAGLIRGASPISRSPRWRSTT